MAISIITDSGLWDRFVDESPHSLIYHKWGFLKLAEKYTGYRFLSYGIFKGDRLVCVFPLFFKSIFGVKMLFSPPPQSGIPYLGPVMEKKWDEMKQDKKESTINLIVQEAESVIKKIAPNYFSMILMPDIGDIRPYIWNGYQAWPNYTYLMDLCPNEKELWNDLTTLCRQNIRKGGELKCRIEESMDPSLLTDLLTDRYQEQYMNFSVDPAYLQEAMKLYPDNLKLECMYDQDHLVCTTLTHYYKRAIGWMGLSKPKEKKYTNANEWLVWKLMLKSKSLAFSQFEMSGANKQSLCRYRSKFNPKLQLYFSISKKDLLGRIAEAYYIRFIKKQSIPGARQRQAKKYT